MWIPTPIYERIPQFWFLLGLLFVAAGLYLGLDYALAFGYAVIGVACCGYGIGIAVMRSRYRNNAVADTGAATEAVAEFEAEVEAAAKAEVQVEVDAVADFEVKVDSDAEFDVEVDAEAKEDRNED